MEKYQMYETTLLVSGSGVDEAVSLIREALGPRKALSTRLAVTKTSSEGTTVVVRASRNPMIRFLSAWHGVSAHDPRLIEMTVPKMPVYFS